MIDRDVLEMLRCPLGKSRLKQENNTLVCIKCNVKFTITDDIPNLIIDEAILPAGVSSISELECQKEIQK